MEMKGEDLWLDHIMAKASWPQPSDDLHARIMQSISHTAVAPMRWGFSLSGLAMAAFALGFFYHAPAGYSADTDAAYYSDTHYEYSNLLGS